MEILPEGGGASVTGWKKISGKWYYFAKKTAVMQTGWQKLSNKWYYFGTDGKMRTGWQKVSGKWYYFGSSGAMLTGAQTISGKQYTFNGSGVWQDPDAPAGDTSGTVKADDPKASTSDAGTVTSISISTMYYTTLPNNNSDYATINWSITGNFGKSGTKVNITESLKCTDYIYKQYDQYNTSRTTSVTLYNTTTYSGSTRVYAVNLNGAPGTSNAVTYTISAGGQTRVMPIGFRAGLFDDPRPSIH